MGLTHIVVGGMGIGTGNHDHSELATTGKEFAEHVPVAQPRAAVVEWDLRRIIRDAAAGTETDRIRFRPLEVIEPELRVELARVILDKRQLCPAHGLVHPSWRWQDRRRRLCGADRRPRRSFQRNRCSRHPSYLQRVSAVHHGSRAPRDRVFGSEGFPSRRKVNFIALLHRAQPVQPRPDWPTTFRNTCARE
jgi:hypothetical protein